MQESKQRANNMTPTQQHQMNINEYKLGLKIVLARLAGANKILDDVLQNPQDSIELDKARRIKQSIEESISIISR